MQKNNPKETDKKEIEKELKLELDLRLIPAGSSVVLEIFTPTGLSRKVHSTFIGYLSKQYVLIQYPDSKKLGHYGNFIKMGGVITVRGLHEGHKFAIVAFTTQVKQTLLQPSKIIVLEFPKEVRVLYLRNGIRLKTEIKATMEFEKNNYAAKVTDLSLCGCQLIINSKEPPTLVNEAEIEVTIAKDKEQESFTVRAFVCNFKQLPTGLSIGVRFIENNLPEIESLLYLSLSNED